MMDYIHLVEAARTAFHAHHDTLQHIGTALDWLQKSVGFLITLEKLRERFWPMPTACTQDDQKEDKDRKTA